MRICPQTCLRLLAASSALWLGAAAPELAAQYVPYSAAYRQAIDGAYPAAAPQGRGANFAARSAGPAVASPATAAQAPEVAQVPRGPHTGYPMTTAYPGPGYAGYTPGPAAAGVGPGPFGGMYAMQAPASVPPGTAPYLAAHGQPPGPGVPQANAMGAFAGGYPPANGSEFAAPTMSGGPPASAMHPQAAMPGMSSAVGAPYGTQPQFATSGAYQVPTGAPVQVAARMQGGAACSCGNPSCDGNCGEGHASGIPSGAPCATGNCAPQVPSYGLANYGLSGCAPYGGCGGYTTYGCGLSGCDSGGGCAPAAAGVCGVDACRGAAGYWFGGVYGLLMERDQSNYLPVGFAATGMAVGDYPMQSDFVLFGDDADVGFQGGVEARLGRAFGGAVDPCTGFSCGPQWGLEGVYWELFESSTRVDYFDTAGMRTYSMIDHRGLEYNPGTGYRPVNHYFDYAPPVADYTGGGVAPVEVRTLCVHRSFEARNFELNLLRLSLGFGGGPAWGVGPAAAAGGGPCGPGGCATNPAGVVTRGQGCCGSRYSFTGVCGFRYFEFDENFWLGVDYENMADNSFGSLGHHLDVENRLAGFQIGGNAMYRIGCRWGIHLNSTVGIFGNDIDVHQYFTSPTNMVRYIGTGDPFDVRASKTDVSMIGELRVGASYQFRPNCRLYGGWRVIGVTGVALAQDQLSQAYVDPAQARWVTSDGSLLLHGLQTGLEWNY